MAVHGDQEDCYDVEYDDGEVEKAVSRDDIMAFMPPLPPSCTVQGKLKGGAWQDGQ